MDNAAAYLVDNPLNRYIVRPDSPGLTYAPEGSLTLYLQVEKPDSVPEGNWLPANPGVFSVTLRTYQPQQAIMDGSWFPPCITRVQ